MASVNLSHIYKVYPNGLKAVNDFSMDIKDREFIVFVGPSGCGKSTTLRMIAGLEDITAGELRIGGEVVNDAEPKDRDIAMVFQNYALYPHMTVYNNMAFGLQLRRIPKDEINRRVNEAARILGITDYLQKKPKEMSGGQRQRVALGRAMVREPKVFLLDEPLSNLDAKLRTQMRSEILKLHDRIKTTFIYVTHDQVEAMTMGTRIVVMRDGYVQQIDTPRNLYSYPCNKFVAGFIGTPQMNFYNGTIKRDGDRMHIKFDGVPVEFDCPYELFCKADAEYTDGVRPVVFGIRSEHVSIDPEKYPYKAKCRVTYCEDLGVDSQVYADFNQGESESLESDTKVIIKAPAATMLEKDGIIDVSLDLSAMHIFDAVTERSIALRVPTRSVFRATVKDGALCILGAKLDLPPAVDLSDGDYKVYADADALTLAAGAPIKAEFTGSEEIGDIRLQKAKAAGDIFFVRSSEKPTKSKGVAIDLKRCLFVAEDGTVAKAAMPMQNRLLCAFKRRTERETAEVDGEQKQVNVKKYSLEFLGRPLDRSAAEQYYSRLDEQDRIRKEYAAELEAQTQKAEAQSKADGKKKKVKVKKPRLPRLKDVPRTPGYSMDVTPDDAQRIITGAGRAVYRDSLEVVCSPYDLKIADTGVEAEVIEIIDYGVEKFAKCRTERSEVYVAVDGDFDASEVKLVPQGDLNVYDRTIDIRLV